MFPLLLTRKYTENLRNILTRRNAEYAQQSVKYLSHAITINMVLRADCANKIITVGRKSCNQMKLRCHHWTFFCGKFKSSQ